ncbi:gluconate 2-dehydrogenase subunit 3 family protein [Spirosoma luteolum]
MMNRRNALARLSLLVGGTLSLPTLQAMSRFGPGGLGAIPTEVDPAGAAFTLTNEQRMLVADVAEHIIPKTDTPGAIDAGVPAFIERMLVTCYREPEQQSFLAGVQQLQQADFVGQSEARKVELLKQLEQQTKQEMVAWQVQQSKMGDNEDKELVKAQAKGLPFWRLMKELTLLGYFTSEPGLTASFEYVPVPGKFELTTLKPNQKLYAY